MTTVWSIMLRADDLIGFKKSLGSSELSLKYGGFGMVYLTASVEGDDDVPPTLDNPYKKFVRKVRGDKSQSEKQLNLAKKSGEITNAIINEFLDWYNNLGGSSGTGDALIDHATVQELFQIGFDNPTAKNTSLAVTEMPIIPERLEYAFNQPQLTELSSVIHTRKPNRVLATDRAISIKHGRRPSILKKARPSAAPSDQESMAVIWEGIENLWSTVSFAHWLKAHPEVPAPAYFIRSNLDKVDLESLIETNEYFADVKTTGNLLRGSLLVPLKPSHTTRGIKSLQSKRSSQQRTTR